MTKIYIPLVGQFENIGDVVLRRELVEWLDGHGQLHVYVGRSSDAYDIALRLPPGSRIYHGVGKWGRAMLSDVLKRRKVAYVYKPGEIQLTWRGLKEHIGLLPLIVMIKQSGGFVGRVGVGSRNFQRVPTAIFRMTLPLSDYTAWRDTKTRHHAGSGDLMPDLGFGHARLRSSTPRFRLTVTMRGDRVSPNDAWIEGIQRAAVALGLRLTVVTQVERDQPLSEKLAERWQCDFVTWGALDHAAQEEAVRIALRESVVVLSDRLHALIVAVTEGATVLSVVSDPTDKVARHFAAAGIPVQVHDSSQMSSAQICDAVCSAVLDGEAQQAALMRAQDALADVRRTFLSRLREKSA